MRVRMFKSQFAPLVESGQKRQTIRPLPKRIQDEPKPGDLESWREWTGLPYRSKQRELAKVKLKHVFPVLIDAAGIRRTDYGYRLGPSIVARADGFKNWSELRAWFKQHHGLPFQGNLIVAEDVK